jgi:thiol-disulfide isomerase/thioredoxin
LIAALAAAVVLALGLVLALTGGDDAGTDQPAFGPMEVTGTPLPALESTEDDAASGRPAPVLEGQSPDGDPVTVGGGTGRPTLVAFLAHWCPHCRRELPLLANLAEAGAFDGVRTVAVLTGSNPSAPNYPPVAWLEREGWTGDVVLDDEAASAARAYGLAAYPLLVVLDGDGDVVARASGELPDDAVTALVDRARG